MRLGEENKMIFHDTNLRFREENEKVFHGRDLRFREEKKMKQRLF